MDAHVQLSDSQRKAVEYPWRAKTSMILATAGSGKTLVLTRRAIRIAKDLVAEGAFHARVLCVCYNRNAADEMRDRMAALLQAENLAEDIYVSRDSSTMPNMVTIEVRTFHAFGFYVLKSSAWDQRHHVNLDGRPIYALTGPKLRTKFFQALQVDGVLSGSNTERQKRGYLSKLLQELSQEKGILFDRQCGELLRTGSLEDRGVRKREFGVYDRMLSENNAVDYSDMVRKTVLLLYYSQKTMNRVRKRYHSVLVDEFQDMSASQVYLCKALVNESNSLTLVGDDDQQIYSFRTGTGWCCHDVLRSVFPDIDTLTLDENHRCTGAVVKAAFAVINNNTNRVPKEIKAVREIGMPVQVIGCRNQQLEMDFVVKRVRSLIPKARKDGQRIILLFRRNILLNEFQKRFTREKIQTTRKATPPRSAGRIGCLTLRVFALLFLLNRNISLKVFLWAATAVSPCTEDSFLRDVLKEHDPTSSGQNPGLAESDDLVECDQDNKEESNPSHNVSPFLRKLRSWHELHTSSSDDQERCAVENLQTLLSIVDALDLKSTRIGSLEDLVQYATKLLTSPTGTSETAVSSQNAINYEPEGHGSNYGTEDPDGPGLDTEAFDILVSAARTLDEEAAVQASSVAVEEHRSAEAAETEEKDSDEDDFAQMFCRDRHLRTTKRRRSTGINPVARDQGESSLTKDVLHRQLEQLCLIVCQKFKGLDGKWLEREPNCDAITVLSTAHGAKGCTFSYVFLCGADSNAFPVGGNSGVFLDSIFCMWGPSFETPSTASLNDPMCQEERRLFFVALTRTVTQFTCTYSPQGLGGCLSDSQSPFIREMLEGLQWDPQYVTESYVNSHEDLCKQFVSATKVEAQASKSKQVKEEQQELK